MPDLTQDSANAIVASYRALQTEALEVSPGLSAPEQFAFRAVELGLEEPGFAWNEWEPVQTREYEQPEFAAGADAETLKRLMTAHVRTERFVGGHLVRMQEEGVLEAIVDRLEALVEADEI